MRAGEMALQLSSHTAVPEDVHLIPSTLIKWFKTTCSSSPWGDDHTHTHTHTLLKISINVSQT